MTSTTNKAMHVLGPWQVTYDNRGRLLEIETVEQEFGLEHNKYRHLTNRLPNGAAPGEPTDAAGNSLEMVATAHLIAAAPDMWDLIEQACELMPLGTTKRAEWLTRASLLRRKVRERQ